MEAVRSGRPKILSKAQSWWRKIASVLAILSLADVFGQVIKWASLINWLVGKYALMKQWLFSLIPLHIPPEWHNTIVLFMIVTCVTNIGYYQQTGRLYVVHLTKTVAALLIGFVLEMLGMFSRRAAQLAPRVETFIVGGEPQGDDVGLGLNVAAIGFPLLLGLALLGERSLDALFGLGKVLESWALETVGFWIALYMMGYSGAFFAWRWMLGTAVGFGAMVGISELYVHVLAPLGRQ